MLYNMFNFKKEKRQYNGGFSFTIPFFNYHVHFSVQYVNTDFLQEAIDELKKEIKQDTKVRNNNKHKRHAK